MRQRPVRIAAAALVGLLCAGAALAEDDAVTPDVDLLLFLAEFADAEGEVPALELLEQTPQAVTPEQSDDTQRAEAPRQTSDAPDRSRDNIQTRTPAERQRRAGGDES